MENPSTAFLAVFQNATLLSTAWPPEVRGEVLNMAPLLNDGSQFPWAWFAGGGFSAHSLVQTSLNRTTPTCGLSLVRQALLVCACVVVTVVVLVAHSFEQTSLNITRPACR